MPAATRTKDPTQARALAFLAEHAVERLRLTALDLLGQSHVLDALEPGFAAALAGALTAQQGVVAGGGDAEVRLQPDSSTLAIWPAALAGGRATASAIAELASPDEAVPCPRRLLRRESSALAGLELQLHIAPRIEFHLLEQSADQDMLSPAEREPLEQFVAGLATLLREAALPVLLIRRQRGPGQLALELAELPAVAAADAIAHLRALVRCCAELCSLQATFLPRPFAGDAGSSLRLGFDLRDASGASLLRDAAPQAQAFAAGLLEHAPGLCALTNPLVNSYKRLLPGRQGSVAAWAASGDLAMLQIRDSAGVPAELRSPDAACHPYLALTALLAAGRDGIARGLELPEPVAGTLAELPRRERARLVTLPSTLHEAIVAFEQDELLATTFGTGLTRPLLDRAKREWAEFADEVHAWELQRYLQRI